MKQLPIASLRDLQEFDKNLLIRDIKEEFVSNISFDVSWFYVFDR